MNDFPNERCWEIVNILLNINKPITISKIAKELDVSNRTIRNDLKEIEDYIKLNNYGKIIKKPRVGVWLECDLEYKHLLINAASKSKVYIQPFSSEERQLFIKKLLLQSSGSITMQFLADELYVSRATIYKDLDEVEEWLLRYNLKLKRKQNYGIELEGDEKDWRKAAADLLTILKSNDQLRSTLTSNKDAHSNNRINFENFVQLKELFPGIDVNMIEQIIMEAEEDMDFRLADVAYEGLIGHIVIGIERLNQNKNIKMNSKQLSAIKEKREFEIAIWIAKRLEERFGIKIPESEVGYISLHILGAKVQQSYKIDDTEGILKNMDRNIINLAIEIITLIGNILSVDLSKDNVLLIGLILHLRPTINRLKYGLSLRNPLLNEIKNNYPSVFGASWATSVLFEKHLGVKVNEEEIAYIATHIGAALERMNSVTRAIIVCGSGIGTSQLVNVRLQKEINDLDIVNIISSHDIDKLKESDFDLVITTIPINYRLKPVININPIVAQRDLDKIKTYIKNIKNTKKFNKDNGNIDTINELFNTNLIYTKINKASKKEVIKYLGENLTKGGYVTDEFVNSALDRERITSTSVGKGVAIPHGVQQYVKESVIAIAVLDKPICWGDSKVDIIFLLALKFSSGNITRKFFKRFYSMLDDEEILRQIRNSQTKEEIYEILVGKDGFDE